MSTRPFPDDFLWGAATSGHQIEGMNTSSDTWFLEHVRPSVFREPSGMACNSWELWADDLDLLVSLGCNAFRFSIEWARIEPAEGTFDEAALDHYEAVIDGCHARGLAPVVTFSHFTGPHWFACRGGWLDPAAPELFARFCDRAMRRFGDRIAVAVTFNEPNLPNLLASIGLPDFVVELERQTLQAAADEAGVRRYRAANVVLAEDRVAIEEAIVVGHRAAKAAIKAVRPDLRVGLSIAMIDEQVVGDDASARDRVRTDLYLRWLTLAAEDDFVGVQNYERRTYDAHGVIAPPPDGDRNHMGSHVDPLSLAAAVHYAYAVSGVPIFVTEHGIATTDDAQRASFIPPALAGLLDAIDDGVPVLGYTHWSLLDNFEWIFGYEPRFGLFAVDHGTFARTAKPSALVYADIVRQNAVGDDG